MARKNRTVAKLRGSSRRPKESQATSRLAAMSARIDERRSGSLARKPVFDKSLNVVAYEIVLGSGSIDEIAIEESADGSRRVMVNQVVDLDIESLSADKPVHLPVSSSLLLAGLPPEFAPDRTELVLGSDVEPTPAVTAAVEDLRRNGYRIILDDLAANPHLTGLVRLADAARVDVGQTQDAPSKQIALLKAADVAKIAERVETYDELRQATKEGFTYFQGSFLGRPDGFKKTRGPASQLASLELITLLQDPEAEISDIANVVRRDVNLSYKILKVVNSAQYSLPRPLGSIEEAVMLVGTKQIVSWVGMMTLAAVADKPPELTRTAMVRARACETLGARLGRQDTQRFYLVGLFSVIEALLDVPAEQALGGLPLSPEIVDAITSGGGIMGEVLRGVIAHADGDWTLAHIIGLQDEVISEAFLDAVTQTDAMWAKIEAR